MARFAVIDDTTKKTVNVVVWEGAIWMAPKGHWVVQNDTVNIGDIYNPQTNTFTRPENPE